MLQQVPADLPESFVAAAQSDKRWWWEVSEQRDVVVVGSLVLTGNSRMTVDNFLKHFLSVLHTSSASQQQQHFLVPDSLTSQKLGD